MESPCIGSNSKHFSLGLVTVTQRVRCFDDAVLYKTFIHRNVEFYRYRTRVKLQKRNLFMCMHSIIK